MRFFWETQEGVWNSHGKRAISVRVIEVLLYLYLKINFRISVVGDDLWLWTIESWLYKKKLPLLLHCRFLFTVDQEDDEVADAVAKDKTPMPLDLVPALTDKTFPTTVQSADLALVYFYIPCKCVWFLCPPWRQSGGHYVLPLPICPSCVWKVCINNSSYCF